MFSFNDHSSDPWRPGSIRNAPLGPFFCLTASLATAAAAVFVVNFADGKEVDSWPVSPSVFLSILATLGGMLLRSAFQAGADTYWWALLLSGPGVKLRALHGSWEIGHNATACFKLWSKNLQPVLRIAAIAILLLGANGPLLQRAVFVKLEEVEASTTVHLPIRAEPMWNLTTKLVRHEDAVYSPPPYQDEFAQAVNDLHQRRPMEMRTDACPRESTCSVLVNIASFSRACVKSYVPVEGAATLPEYQMIPRGLDAIEKCQTTGLDDGNGTTSCRYLNLEYQLGLLYLDVGGNKTSGNRLSGPGPEELPWLGENLPPFGIQYTSYFKEDADSDMIAIQKCNFTSAYVTMPIEITQGKIVTITDLTDAQMDYHNKGYLSIPAFAKTPHMGDRGFHPLAGLKQTMADLYGGYMFYDQKSASNVVGGSGPKQFINQTTIKPRPEGDGQNIRGGYSANIIDPVNDFTNTLHELSLRYALQAIPSTPERLEEMNDFHDMMLEAEPSMDDRLQKARAKLDQRINGGKTQTNVARETKMTAVYRVDYIYAAIAAGLTCLSAVLSALLFAGWRRLGRRFTTSPVEVAKAFEAPMLAAIGSNARGGDIANNHGSIRVRYGEKGDPGGDGLLADGSRLSGAGAGKGWGTASVTGQPGAEGGEVRMRLVVDAAERISPPVKGRTYE